MRTLHLTSPPMHGPDIKRFQRLLDERLAHYHSRTRVGADGVFGPASEHALESIGYIMGLEPPYGRTAALRLIEHPHLRSPRQLKRSRARQKARAHHHSSGLLSIPAIAQRYVGVHESPANSNWGFPNPADWLREFGFGPASWCGCFAGAMIRLAGGHVTSRVAYCPNIEADGRSHTNGFDRFVPNHGEGVGPGWLVLFNWEGGSEPEHVEIVKEVGRGGLLTIGGNTGGSNPGWGGMVGSQWRPFGLSVGYARPRL